jgi:Kef-type K+ transport system membrane component KefB
MPLASFQAPSGPVLEFFVLFAVILAGPIIVSRLGLPGLIGLVLGGFVIGSHGLDLIGAGNQTVPELGKLGLLYLMFVAGVELDLQVLKEYRRAALALGVLAFAVPFAAGFGIGVALGWSFPAKCLLGALLSSHTLLVYPMVRDAGLGHNRAVSSAVGATVLTDTLALTVLAIVAGTQTGSGSVPVILAEIALGLAVLIAVALAVLPRLVDLAFRRFGSDRVSRYLVIVVALLVMAMLAEVFDIEAIVGAFFAGLAVNRLVPNESPSMDRVEFLGKALFVPVFLVSIGLLLDPSVMFTAHTLGLAALIIAGAIGGKAIACWLAGSLLGFSRPERLVMFALTTPQAAATLAVTLIGFEIGLFGTSVLNAVLVLILVSIVVGALLAERAARWVPRPTVSRQRLGGRVLVVTPSTEPSEKAIRTAELVARPDYGYSDLMITRTEADPPLDAAVLRDVERRLFGQGFDGDVRIEFGAVQDAVLKAVRAGEPTLVIVDDPTFDSAPGRVPVLVVDGVRSGQQAVRLIVDGGADGVADELARRLEPRARRRVSLTRR